MSDHALLLAAGGGGGRCGAAEPSVGPTGVGVVTRYTVFRGICQSGTELPKEARMKQGRADLFLVYMRKSKCQAAVSSFKFIFPIIPLRPPGHLRRAKKNIHHATVLRSPIPQTRAMSSKYLLRRCLDPPNPPQTPSQKVRLEPLGYIYIETHRTSHLTSFCHANVDSGFGRHVE